MNNLLKIIFLDIDGVLNGYANTDLIENTFSKYKLDLFKQLYDSLENVLVVVTSDRRTLKAERETIDKVFDEYNLNNDEIKKIDFKVDGSNHYKCHLDK